MVPGVRLKTLKLSKRKMQNAKRRVRFSDNEKVIPPLLNAKLRERFDKSQKLFRH